MLVCKGLKAVGNRYKTVCSAFLLDRKRIDLFPSTLRFSNENALVSWTGSDFLYIFRRNIAPEHFAMKTKMIQNHSMNYAKLARKFS